MAEEEEGYGLNNPHHDYEMKVKGLRKNATREVTDEKTGVISGYVDWSSVGGEEVLSYTLDPDGKFTTYWEDGKKMREYTPDGYSVSYDSKGEISHVYEPHEKRLQASRSAPSKKIELVEALKASKARQKEASLDISEAGKKESGKTDSTANTTTDNIDKDNKKAVTAYVLNNAKSYGS